MNTIAFLMAVVLGLMIAEARLSRQNERRLRAEGAHAPAGDVYGPLVVIYPVCFLAMGAEGLWRAGTAGLPAVQAGPSWMASGVLLFVASKGLRYWAMRSLGERWTIRVLVLPGAPLVTAGPYRYAAHPNYLGVAGELAGAAMMCGALVTGPAAGVALGAVLLVRVRFEARVLRAAAGAAAAPGNSRTS